MAAAVCVCIVCRKRENARRKTKIKKYTLHASARAREMERMNGTQTNAKYFICSSFIPQSSYFSPQFFQLIAHSLQSLSLSLSARSSSWILYFHSRISSGGASVGIIIVLVLMSPKIQYPCNARTRTSRTHIILFFLIVFRRNVGG